MSGSASSRDRRHTGESSELDPETLDPDMHYRFFHSSPTRIARARSLGYRPVKREDGVRTMFDQDEDDGTGTIVHGDRILYQIPKEKYDLRRRRKLKLANQRMKGPAERFKEKARREGVEIAEGSRNEPKDEEE